MNTRDLADLWPKGWLMPTMLKKYRTISPEEHQDRVTLLEKVETERDLAETIRAGVAAAAMWEEMTDDYGRVYYANWKTGEAVYEPPQEMVYKPPLGRNKLGRAVDARLQALW
ncbi:unnamed protein product [Choristocarpus tenellus]